MIAPILPWTARKQFDFFIVALAVIAMSVILVPLLHQIQHKFTPTQQEEASFYV